MKIWIPFIIIYRINNHQGELVMKIFFYFGSFEFFYPGKAETEKQQNSSFSERLGSSRVGSQGYSQCTKTACQGKAWIMFYVL